MLKLNFGAYGHKLIQIIVFRVFAIIATTVIIIDLNHRSHFCVGLDGSWR